MNRKLSSLVTVFVIVLALAAVWAISVPSLLRSRTGARFQSPPYAAFDVADDLDREAPLHNTESYSRIYENPFLDVFENPLSTFSIDVDTASYANVRRFLKDGGLPPPDAVRIEELLNYFSYEYPEPDGSAPFSVTTEVGECPWKAEHRLLLIGLKARALAPAQLPPRNLVFLIDVSGSMDDPKKLPLLQRALDMLVERLAARDRVAMVVYAGSAGLVLPPTSGGEKATIREALYRLTAGGSTAGGEGIELAYKIASENFLPESINRVLLATDGDWNVGVTSEGDLTRLIEEKRRSGVFLSVLGFGMGNLKDSLMEKLADSGNGNYSYIDSLSEARKVLVQEAGGTLVTVARDVKIQVEFNPRRVASYRLIGYENRLLRNEDFNDDTKDAGELGAGHAVTALYELVPKDAAAPERGVDPLKYQQARAPSQAAGSEEVSTVKLRYQPPAGGPSTLVTSGVRDAASAASTNLRWASAVAGFGMLLRGSDHRAQSTYALVEALAGGARGTDREGYRAEFLELVALARKLSEGRVVLAERGK